MPSGQDTFQQGQTATTGPFTGAYLWSNTANWVDGVVPVSGDSVSNSAGGFNFDDIIALVLGSLTQGANADTDVVATSLTVGTVTSSGDLVADAFEAGAPVRMQIGTITGTGGVYTADDTGAVLVDLSAVDQGNNLYATISGGFVTLAAAPASTSTLAYIDGPSTFALENPAATTATAVNGVVDGDVLELPGSSVSAVSFGTNSLTITTNVSSYTFQQRHPRRDDQHLCRDTGHQHWPRSHHVRYGVLLERLADPHTVGRRARRDTRGRHKRGDMARRTPTDNMDRYRKGARDPRAPQCGDAGHRPQERARR
jgi:hypothetical protein